MVLFGFAIATQFVASESTGLDRLSETQLIQLLDELRSREAKLTGEQADLEQQLRQLKSAATSQEEAQKAAEARQNSIAILSGSTPVKGNGVTATITDPKRAIPAGTIVNLLGELRNAGAEAIDISGQRVVASSSVSKKGDSLLIDGQQIAPPYRLTALGDPSVLSVALNIPGGAVSRLKSYGARVTITSSPNLTIDSFITPKPSQWAQIVRDN
ncbi:hypothetical protein BK816_04455 [Boudabousia tangfeifanii]|uniref:DUF881 domain-containing protein n=2 Tax=Boudabousia tangfeifanii TaxID=1912795 RepID=A0A1D9MKE7_9ACTO|nr:hypothetical protein BK816_04455 [Boudabousia tangfeifanii]